MYRCGSSPSGQPSAEMGVAFGIQFRSDPGSTPGAAIYFLASQSKLLSFFFSRILIVLIVRIYARTVLPVGCYGKLDLVCLVFP